MLHSTLFRHNMPPMRFIKRLRQGLTRLGIVPPIRRVRFGDLRRVTPISRNFGFDRGQPIDRYYIERFLATNAADIRGRVLEIGDNSYTTRFGNGRVTSSDILNVKEGNPRSTIVADLSEAKEIASESFDCIILTQTLHLIYDVRAALHTLSRILKPNGTLLATFPGISQIDHHEWATSWYWSFTTRSAKRLLEESCSNMQCRIRSHGNVLAATAFLHGLATSELRDEELDYEDADYEVLITVRGVKGSSAC